MFINQNLARSHMASSTATAVTAVACFDPDDQSLVFLTRIASSSLLAQENLAHQACR